VVRRGSSGQASEPAGYSGVSTAKKLGVKEDSRLVVVGPPVDWEMFDLPSGVRVEVARDVPVDQRSVEGKAVVLAFFPRAADYAAALPALAELIFPDASLWAAWPRRAGGHVSDLTDVVIREGALRLGLVDNKVAAIDLDWSGLRLVWRKELRLARG
jgi:hypothetical protein